VADGERDAVAVGTLPEGLGWRFRLLDAADCDAVAGVVVELDISD
jgi:hypothetical protein